MDAWVKRQVHVEGPEEKGGKHESLESQDGEGATGTVNVGTSASTVNIGTNGAGPINIGNVSSPVTLSGTIALSGTTTVNTLNVNNTGLDFNIANNATGAGVTLANGSSFTGSIGIGAGSLTRAGNLNIGTGGSGPVTIGNNTAPLTLRGSSIVLTNTTTTNSLLNVNNLMNIQCGSTTFAVSRQGDNAFWISSTNFTSGVYLTGGSSAGWTNVSDRTLKTNIEPLTNMLDKVNALNPVKFKYIGNDEEICNGFIAQELQIQFPELIKESSGKLGIAYTGLISVVVKAIQEQQEQINILKDKIKALENK